MKTFITWAVILVAITVAIIEYIYGNPYRLIIYLGIIGFMWIADKIQKYK
jgi:hypothetical protein